MTSTKYIAFKILLAKSGCGSAWLAAVLLGSHQSFTQINLPARRPER